MTTITRREVNRIATWSVPAIAATVVASNSSGGVLDVPYYVTFISGSGWQTPSSDEATGCPG